MLNVKEKLMKSFISPLDQYLSVRPSVAIDLGTATTRFFNHKGHLIERPSSVKLRTNTESCEDEPPVLYPLQDGVIRDLPAAVSLLRPMLRKSGRFWINPIGVACVPTTATLRDRQRLHEVLLMAGCSSVEIIQEPLAAAIGAKIDVGSDYAQMLIDIGEGITDLVIIRQNQLIRTKGLNVACGSVHASIQKEIYRRYRIWLSDSEVRQIAFRQGNVLFQQGQIEIKREDITGAMHGPIALIADATLKFFHELPDDVACEVIETGITLTGGGALLPDLVNKLQIETFLHINVPADPLRSVIRGAASLFDHL